MAKPESDLAAVTRRVDWVRLRTLITLRWIAVAGQLIAITTAQRLFDLNLELGLAFLAIGASVTANIVAIFVYPENKRLSETELTAQLLFDTLQLAFLLFLTGGLHNPFALLMLVPVTVSATALRLKTTILIGVVAVIAVSVVAQYHIPLRTEFGFIMRMPQDFLVGFWVAIIIGIAFLAAFAQRVTSEVYAMSDALAATQMALAREQKLTDLGGVVAAAAHELGTPLATIKLVSSELADELGDRPDLAEDIALLGEQADRCRDILRSMGRAGKDDLHIKRTPLAALVREAAEPHQDRGVELIYDISPKEESDGPQPMVQRKPEIIHGLRNLIQNAVDFADEAVLVNVSWSPTSISVRVTDDGPGFPSQLIGRIGDPFVGARRGRPVDPDRPYYEGMGLGLFIAKTLLERSGAELTFANRRDTLMPMDSSDRQVGAIVDVTWPRGAIESVEPGQGTGLGENANIEL